MSKKNDSCFILCFVLINHTFWRRMKNEYSKQRNDHGFNNNNSSRLQQNKILNAKV